MQKDLKPLTEHLGYAFQDERYLHLALTHPSFDEKKRHNQRLEFLGDAVLDLIITETLYHENPDVEEGMLDHMRASLVNGKRLTEKAIELQVGAYLRVSEAQRQHMPEPSKSMLEDAFEAIIGAIYLDGGLGAAGNFIKKVFAQEISSALNLSSMGNPKGKLQEWAQKTYSGATPVYLDLNEEGPDHARRFTVAVLINDEELGRGTGSSKKAAETNAAETAIQRIKSE